MSFVLRKNPRRPHRITGVTTRQSLVGRRTFVCLCTVAATALLLVPASSAAASRFAEPAGKTHIPNANFTIGLADSNPVSSFLASDGTAYLVYVASKTQGGVSKAYVCVLPRGARKCSRTTLLTALDPSTNVDSNAISMLAGPSGTIDIILTSDNDSNADDHTTLGEDADVLEYVINTAGELTGQATRIGTLDSEGNAISYKGQILWIGSGEQEVQESPADGSNTGWKNITKPIQLNLAGTPMNNEFEVQGGDIDALPNGDVLAAWDDSSNAYVVELNPANNFSLVGWSEFKGWRTHVDAGVSSELSNGPHGTYLLLRQSSNEFSGGLELLRYVGKGKFGTPVHVPSPNDDKGASYSDYRLVQLTDGGFVVVYMEDQKLYEEVSYNQGKTWSKFAYAGDTPYETENLAPALTAFGAGVVFEASGGSVGNKILPEVQPVWVHQSVGLTISPSVVKVGKPSKATGVISWAHAGQTVTLEKEVGKQWKAVRTLSEPASGKFSFALYTGSDGTTAYRVTTSQVPGWFFGDSSATKTLNVYTPRKT